MATLIVDLLRFTTIATPHTCPSTKQYAENLQK
jgi:hypothetical protein